MTRVPIDRFNDEEINSEVLVEPSKLPVFKVLVVDIGHGEVEPIVVWTKESDWVYFVHDTSVESTDSEFEVSLVENRNPADREVVEVEVNWAIELESSEDKLVDELRAREIRKLEYSRIKLVNVTGVSDESIISEVGEPRVSRSKLIEDEISGVETISELEAGNVDAIEPEVSEISKMSELSKPTELVWLSELRELTEVNKLSELSKLSGVEKVSGIEEVSEVEGVSELSRLNELRKLSEVEVISELSKNNELSEVRELGELNELNEHKELDELSEVKELSGLSEAEELSGLSKVVELSEVEKLSELEELSELSEVG